MSALALICAREAEDASQKTTWRGVLDLGLVMFLALCVAEHLLAIVGRGEPGYGFESVRTPRRWTAVCTVPIPPFVET